MSKAVQNAKCKIDRTRRIEERGKNHFVGRRMQDEQFTRCSLKGRMKDVGANSKGIKSQSPQYRNHGTTQSSAERACGTVSPSTTFRGSRSCVRWGDQTLRSANPLHKRLTVETTYARYGLSTHEDDAFHVVVTALLPPVFVLEGKVQGCHLADRTRPMVENS